MAERIDVDVGFVGAGYAGPTAARRLTRAGRSAVVLAARDRVGGRIWTRLCPKSGGRSSSAATGRDVVRLLADRDPIPAARAANSLTANGQPARAHHRQRISGQPLWTHRLAAWLAPKHDAIVGRARRAGTEIATISSGAIDGAARSGERAAGEILDAA